MAASVSKTICQPILNLAVQCQECYQCGQCTSACPSGWDLNRGPRLVMRLLLTGDIDKILACEDIWRCSECRSCNRACPMEIDIAGALSKLRMLELEHGIQRCPEREGTRVAIKYLANHKHVDKIMFGMTMASRGFMPRDKKGAINTVIQTVGNMVTRSLSNGRIQVAADSKKIQTSADPTPGPFFAGCVLRQDAECYNSSFAPR
jgi:heterodisulfide reductase subunit C